MKHAILFLVILGLSWDVMAQPPLNKRDQQRKAEFEAQIAAEEKYDELLRQADIAFKNKDYVKARWTYDEAVQYSPENEQWLISKVNDLDILMAKIIAREIDSVLVIDGRELSPITNSLAQDQPSIESRDEPVVMEFQPLRVEQPEKPAIKEPEDTTPEPLVRSEVKQSATTLNSEPKKEETKVKEDFTKYPQGISEEVFEFPDHTVTRIIVKDGIDTIVYKYVTHRWGGKFHFKDDVSISERIWNEEVQSYKEKYPAPNKDE